MEREVLNPPRVRVDLRETACTTLLAYAGAYQLTLDSAVAELGVELHSTYLGQRRIGYIATNHLAVVAGQPPRVFCAPDDDAESPVGERRRDCLMHHVDQLSVLVAEVTGQVVVIDVSPISLERMDATAAGAGGALNPG